MDVDQTIRNHQTAKAAYILAEREKWAPLKDKARHVLRMLDALEAEHLPFLMGAQKYWAYAMSQGVRHPNLAFALSEIFGDGQKLGCLQTARTTCQQAIHRIDHLTEADVFREVPTTLRMRVKGEQDGLKRVKEQIPQIERWMKELEARLEHMRKTAT